MRPNPYADRRDHLKRVLAAHKIAEALSVVIEGLEDMIVLHTGLLQAKEYVAATKDMAKNLKDLQKSYFKYVTQETSMLAGGTDSCH